MTAAVARAGAWRGFATGVELLLVVWLVPLAILLVGLPLVAAIRLLLELLEVTFGR